jgi:D-alanyl-D-alanine carboxypeptidase
LIQNFPEQYGYFSRGQYTFRGRKYLNHNSLLRSFPGTDGIKTGYIRASGFNLAVSAKRRDRRLIAVVFGGRTANSRDKHITKLLERGFKKIAGSAKTIIALKQNPVSRVATIPPASSARAAKGTGPILHPTPPRANPRPGRKPAPPPKSNEWSIQVGAYGDIAPARLAVHRAITRIPKLNANTRVAISPYYAGKRLMYRARLIGLSRASARTACLRLERRKIPCITIAPNRALPSDAPRSQTAKRTR